MNWSRRKSLLLLSAVPFAATVSAQDALPQDDSVATVTVTGARAAGRTVLNSPAPIDVVGAPELESANKSDLLDVINTTVPSWNTPMRGGTSGHGSMVRAAQLRGLSPNHTLVLINGKRWHNTALLTAGGLTGQAPVDIALIPSGIIERVEVLRDGASAIYGSDAIAGVINIITNKSASGSELSYRQGEYFEGDGRSKVIRGSTGFSWGDQGYVRLSGQFNDTDRTSTNTAVPSNYLYYFPLNANGVPVLPVTPTGQANPTTGYLLPAGATADPREATRNNYVQQINGSRGNTLKSGSIDIGHALTETVDFYSFLNYSHRGAWAPQNYRPAYRDETVRAIFPNGYAPHDELDEDDGGGTIGLKGSLASAWDWDLSSTYGQDRIKWYIHDDLNPTYGVNSKTSFFIGELKYSGWTSNFDLRRSFEVGGLAEALQFATGVEYRRDGYRRGNGEPQSYTDGGVNVLDGPNAGKDLPRSVGYSQSQPGFAPSDNVDVTRNSHAFYASASLNPTRRWVVDLAARYEDFSDFGDTVSARLSSRYEFTDRFAVRLTASNGFQAPVLQAPSYKSDVSSPTFVTHTLATTSATAQALGAKPLQPEKSRDYTAGIVFEPLRGLHVAIDAYRIDVDGRIAATTTFGESLYPGSGALLVAAGLAAADRVNYLINAADTRTDGVDLTIEKSLNLDRFGVLHLTAAANVNHAKLRGVASTPAILSSFTIPVFSDADKNQLLYLSPKSKEILSADWRKGSWSTTLRFTHYGDLDRYGAPTTVATTGPYAGLAQIPYNIGAAWVTDVDLGYRFSDALSVSASVNNLFDKKPGKLPQPLVQPNQYYAYAQNGPLTGDGGFYSATVRYQW
ncbi:MAG: TonB-dependent receptor [Gammaproteobacteria bacterium]